MLMAEGDNFTSASPSYSKISPVLLRAEGISPFQMLRCTCEPTLGPFRKNMHKENPKFNLKMVSKYVTSAFGS